MKNSFMIACWSGMGNVGLQAAEYIRQRLNAKPLADIDLSKIVLAESVDINKGISSLPGIGKLSLYYTGKPPLIIFSGKEQFYGQAGIAAMEELLDTAERFDVKKIFTGAAFPTYMNYQDESKVYIAANSKTFLNILQKDPRLLTMAEGQISGLNGLLLESARKRKIHAACLLATLPIYAISFPNPKASKAIIKILQNIIGFDIDMTEIDLSIHELDKTLHGVEQQLKQLGVKEDGGTPPAQPKENHLPKNIIDKIERLFVEAKKDKKNAYKLKEELDRWNLYNMYEDRFLDLFREGC